MLTPDFVKLSHNGASDAQASVYLWVRVAIGVYVGNCQRGKNVRGGICPGGMSGCRHRRYIETAVARLIFNRRSCLCQLIPAGSVGAVRMAAPVTCDLNRRLDGPKDDRPRPPRATVVRLTTPRSAQLIGFVSRRYLPSGRPQPLPQSSHALSRR